MQQTPKIKLMIAWLVRLWGLMITTTLRQTVFSHVAGVNFLVYFRQSACIFRTC